MSHNSLAFDNIELYRKYPKTLDVLLQLMFDESRINVRGGKVDNFDISPDTYDDLDEWFRDEFGITPEYFYDTRNYFEELLNSVDYYVDDGETYIELSKNPILYDVSSEISAFDWDGIVEDAIEIFEDNTGVEVFILGRSGKHVCVELNLDNLINFNKLKAEVESLQKEMITKADSYVVAKESFGYDTSVDDPEIYEIDASLNDDIDFNKKIVNREELFNFVNRVADLYGDDAPENEILAISTFLGDYSIYIRVTESMTLDEDIEDDNIYALARDLADLYKDYDIYEFRDCYDSDEEAIFEIASTIKDENVDSIFMYLNHMIDNEAGELKTEAENLISRLKAQLNINECLTEDFDDEDKWIEVKSKNVYDTDGFMTDYTMYKNSDGTKYIFMFGDKDIYEPDEDYADWVCETEEEANEWFDSYGKEEDDFDEDWEDDDFDSYLEGEDDSQEWLDDPDIGIFGFEESLTERLSEHDTNTTVWVNKNQYNYNTIALLFNDEEKTYNVITGMQLALGKYKKATKPEIYRKVKELQDLGYKEVKDDRSIAGLDESVTTRPIATYYTSGNLGILIYNINYDIDDEVVWAWSNTPDELETSTIEYEYVDNEYDSRAFFMADGDKIYLDDCLRSFNESKSSDIYTKYVNRIKNTNSYKELKAIDGEIQSDKNLSDRDKEHLTMTLVNKMQSENLDEAVSPDNSSPYGEYSYEYNDFGEETEEERKKIKNYAKRKYNVDMSWKQGHPNPMGSDDRIVTHRGYLNDIERLIASRAYKKWSGDLDAIANFDIDAANLEDLHDRFKKITNESLKESTYYVHFKAPEGDKFEGKHVDFPVNNAKSYKEAEAEFKKVYPNIDKKDYVIVGPNGSYHPFTGEYINSLYESSLWTNLNGMEQQATETAIDLIQYGTEVNDAVKQAISRCHDAMDDMDIEYGRIGETYEEEPIDEAKVIEYVKSRI